MHFTAPVLQHFGSFSGSGQSLSLRSQHGALEGQEDNRANCCMVSLTASEHAADTLGASGLQLDKQMLTGWQDYGRHFLLMMSCWVQVRLLGPKRVLWRLRGKQQACQEPQRRLQQARQHQ